MGGVPQYEWVFWMECKGRTDDGLVLEGDEGEWEFGGVCGCGEVGVCGCGCGDGGMCVAH